MGTTPTPVDPEEGIDYYALAGGMSELLGQLTQDIAAWLHEAGRQSGRER